MGIDWMDGALYRSWEKEKSPAQSNERIDWRVGDTVKEATNKALEGEIKKSKNTPPPKKKG